MRGRIGKWKYALKGSAEIAGFHAAEIVEIDELITRKTSSFEMAGGGRIGVAMCERMPPQSSGLEQRFRAFHASLNTTNRQRSI